MPTSVSWLEHLLGDTSFGVCGGGGRGVGVLHLRIVVLGCLLVPLQGCAHLPLGWELKA